MLYLSWTFDTTDNNHSALFTIWMHGQWFFPSLALWFFLNIMLPKCSLANLNGLWLEWSKLIHSAPRSPVRLLGEHGGLGYQLTQPFEHCRSPFLWLHYLNTITGFQEVSSLACVDRVSQNTKIRSDLNGMGTCRNSFLHSRPFLVISVMIVALGMFLQPLYICLFLTYPALFFHGSDAEPIAFGKIVGSVLLFGG